MTDNIVDFLAHRKPKSEEPEVVDMQDEEAIHEICTQSANDLLNNLGTVYGLDLTDVECSPEMVFFFEAHKSMIMKSVGQWHPFQDMAEMFMEDQNITIEEYDGGYRYVMNPIEEEEDIPANDE